MRILNSIEQHNVNTLKSYLKDRLKISSKTKSLDAFGNLIYVDCDVFSDAALENFLFLALSDFNQVPEFTILDFNDTKETERFASILVEGALLYCLSSQALLEKGREFTVMDDGIEIDPPSVSQILMEQYRLLLPMYWEKLRLIKKHMTE